MTTTRSINGKPAGSIGYGLLGLTIPWAPVEYETAAKLLKTALENGANVWNGSIHYGTPEANSTHLLRRYFQQYPEDADKVILTMKGAYSAQGGPDGSPEGVRKSVEQAYEVLKDVKTIDVFAPGRVDPNVPIETTIATLAELVGEGKIGSIGLSECSANTIRKAVKIHPIATAEIEMSLFTPDPVGNGVVQACSEHNVQILAYSPIGRGFLSDNHSSMRDLPADDFRRRLPRFQPEAIEQNTRIAAAVQAIASRKGVTTSQVALAWVVAHGAIPIPGSKNTGRVAENCLAVGLSVEEQRALQTIVETMPVSGLRYGGEHEKLLNA